jgi:hypothetical protein
VIEEWVVPQVEGREIAPVPRATTVDAHLGDGLFELNVLLHYHTAIARGWDGRWTEELFHPHAYQTQLENDAIVRLFRPGGQQRDYFANFCARINAAGFRAVWPFPGAVDARGIDLHRARLWGQAFLATDLRHANLSGARLEQAILFRARLDGCDLRLADVHGADVRGATVVAAIIDGLEGGKSAAAIERAVVNDGRVPPEARARRRIRRPNPGGGADPVEEIGSAQKKFGD